MCIFLKWRPTFSFLFSSMVLITEVLSFLFSPEHVEIICLSPSIAFFHPRDKSHWKRVKWEEKWKRDVLLPRPSLFSPPSFSREKVQSSTKRLPANKVREHHETLSSASHKNFKFLR